MTDYRCCPACGCETTTKRVDGRDRRYCPACDTIHWQNPKPVAWALVHTDDAVAMMKRAQPPDKGAWSIPGGFLEREESFATAAARELGEETGITVAPDALNVFDTLTVPRHEEPVVGVVFQTYAALRPEDIAAGDEALDVRLWPFDEVDSLDTIRPTCQPFLSRLRNTLQEDGRARI